MRTNPETEAPAVVGGFDLRAAIDELARLGPRHTGNDAHAHLESLVIDGFRDAGASVSVDEFLVLSWEAGDVRLEIAMSRREPPRSVSVSSAYPHCGATGADGVAGPLCDLGPLTSVELDGIDVRGRIILVTYPPIRQPLAYGSIWGIATPRRASAPERWGLGSHHWLAIENLRGQLGERGALALIIGWGELSGPAAAGQYQPILPPSVQQLYSDADGVGIDPVGAVVGGLPAVWVDSAARAGLSNAAQAGASVHLILTAEPVRRRRTASIIAELPGVEEDKIVLVTHTDGLNVIQENGPVALVALAHRFAVNPSGRRRHGLAFVAATAHLCRTVLDPDGRPSIAESDGVLARHPELRRQARAVVGIEHLGSLEAEDGGAGWEPTGRNEWVHCVTEHPEMAAAALGAIRSAGSGPAIVAAGRVWGLALPWADAGIPTLSYGASPVYAMSESSDGHRRFCSTERMTLELEALGEIVERLDRNPPSRAAVAGART